MMSHRLRAIMLRVVKTHPHAKAIRALGGPTALARELNTQRPRVQAWTKRGVPHRWRYRVAKLLILRGQPLPEKFLDGDQQ